MAFTERTYTIHLRKELTKVAEYLKAKKAMNGVVAFISHHMKQPDHNKIIIKPSVNLEIWKHGMRNPPVRIKVNVTKEDNGLVVVSLYGAKEKEPKKEDKKSEKLEAKVEEKKVEGKAKVAEEHADHKHAEKPKKEHKKPSKKEE